MPAMAGNSSTDELYELIAAVRRGDDDAFTRLCDRYSALIGSSVSRYSRMGAEYGDLRDDFSQEATVALYRAAMSFDLSQSAVTFGLFAKTCIRNSLVSQLRKLGARPQKSRRDVGEPDEDVENTVISGEMRSLFLRRVEGVLSPFEAKVLIMSMEGKPPRHIAKELEATVKTVYNALFRAREKIRRDPDILS